MVIYTGTLDRVIDGTTLDIEINLGGGQTEINRIRLSGIQADNIFKKYRTGKEGGAGVFAKLELQKWLYENSPNLSIEYETTDICGRWLGIVTAEGNEESLNEYMKKKIYKNIDWNKEEQEALVNDWFEGEQITIPGGDELPIFHIWGKSQFLGPAAVQINLL